MISTYIFKFYILIKQLKEFILSSHINIENALILHGGGGGGEENKSQTFHYRVTWMFDPAGQPATFFNKTSITINIIMLPIFILD